VKGVTYIRVKLKPVAECQHHGCGWVFDLRAVAAVTVRANAERHVQATGHIVDVTVSDITQYSREPRGEVTQ
jgi:hypothetical protein